MHGFHPFGVSAALQMLPIVSDNLDNTTRINKY